MSLQVEVKSIYFLTMLENRKFGCSHDGFLTITHDNFSNWEERKTKMAKLHFLKV